VNAEIEYFIQIAGVDRILCLIADGKPPACFPSALGTHEPMAADARPGADGRDGAKLRVISGLMGVDLATLRQRDSQRRQRRMIWVSTVSVLITVLMAALAASALIARAAARQEATRATALNDFMAQMLTASDAEARGSRDVTVIELLGKSSETVSKTLAGQPEAEAEARSLLGNTFRSLGKNDEARVELERAVGLRSGIAGSDRAAYARSLFQLGLVEHDRGDYAAAVERYMQARDVFAEIGDEDIEERAQLYLGLSRSRIRMLQFAEAEQDLDTSDRLLARLSGEHPGDRAQHLDLRATLAMDWKDDAEQAERLSAEALTLFRKGDYPYQLLDGLNSLAVIKVQRGKLGEAQPLFEEALGLARETFGDRSQSVAIYLENLGNLHLRRGELDKTTAALEEVLSIREEIYGQDSAPAVRTRINMGNPLLQLERVPEALQLLDEVLDGSRKHYGEKSLEVAVVLKYRGAALEALGDLGAASKSYESALAILDAMDAPAASWRIKTMLALVGLRCKQGDRDRARGIADQARQVLDPEKLDHREWISALDQTMTSCTRVR
jgi:serine/threonine-protein kinase